MTRERLKSPRARLFVALDLPDEVRAGLVAWGERQLSDPALRPVRAESLHITLCFLGYLPEKRIDEIAAIVRGRPPEPVPLRFDPLPGGKPGGRPRLYALDVHSPAAVEVQAGLEAELIAARAYEPERRPFRPHVTLARVRPVRGTRKPRPVERAPGELPQALVHTFDSVRIALYRSNLRPSGAQYVSLANLDLPPSA